jgi:hypothetical protein
MLSTSVSSGDVNLEILSLHHGRFEDVIVQVSLALNLALLGLKCSERTMS